MVINPATERRSTPATKTGARQMRTLSFVLACAFVLAAPSMAGSAGGGLPGIGTFAYNGSAIPASIGRTIVVAAR
jgi:hypothetical protein